MKFAVKKAALVDTLSRLMGVVERRNTIPILANISIEAVKDRVRFAATDMDMEVSEWLDGNVAEPGSVTVPAATLSDIAKKINADLIDFTLRDYRMKIAGGKAQFTLGTLPAEDFPLFKVSEGEACLVEMDSEELRQTIDRVKGAVSTEESRYYLNGACFHPHPEAEKAFRAVATDGHRLARTDVLCIEVDGTIPRVIIPRKALAEMRRIVDKPAGSVQLTFRENTVALACGGVTLKSKLIDGTFPDYEQIIPKDSAALLNFTLQTVDFRNAVERVGVMAEGNTPAIALTFGGGKAELRAGAGSDHFGEDEITAEGEGSLRLGFNANYLAEMTGHFPGSFTIALSDEVTAAKITSSDDPTYLYVLMPMRV